MPRPGKPRRSYDAQRSSVLGWLLMICRSRALDLLRKRRTRNETLAVSAIDLAEHTDQPEDLLSLIQQRSRVHAALILEGEIFIGAHRLCAGDMHVATAGTAHPAITSPRGALLLVRAQSCPKQ